MDYYCITWRNQFINFKNTIIKVKGKHIVVIGLLEVVYQLQFFFKKGANVFVSDLGVIEKDFKVKLLLNSIPFEENGHSNKAKFADFVVVSPSVPTNSTIIQDYLEHNISIYSEIEIASWFANQKIFAITGSNGKTTVTSWLAHIWEKAELDFTLAGNIGYAFSEKVLKANGPYILEISSFQLDHIHSFEPNISLLLNITPDHLDR